MSRRTRVRRGIARAEAWLGTCRHVDSRTSTVVQVRGVSTTEEREGLWTWRRRVGLPRRALLAVAVPRGVLCNKRADYEPKHKIVFVIPQQIYATREKRPPMFSQQLIFWWFSRHDTNVETGISSSIPVSSRPKFCIQSLRYFHGVDFRSVPHSTPLASLSLQFSSDWQTDKLPVTSIFTTPKPRQNEALPRK